MTALAQLPFAQAHPLATAPGLRALQSRGPIHRVRTAVGDDAWMVTGHALLRQLMDDDRLGRSHPEPGTAARSGDSALFGGPLGEFETEAADHARMRALLQPHFTPKHMRSLAPKLDALIAGRLDELEKHGCPADLHAEVALPVPILVICDLLGVPYSDRDQFRAWVDDAGCVNDRARSEHGLAELFGYGMTLVERKHAHPDDDVISRLCATEGVGDLEAATLSMQLLFAGHETTVVAIGRGTLLLLTNRDQWQALLDDPALIPHAVEELLRASPPGGIGIPRYARTDLDIAGVTIRAGDLVLLDIGSANFDPRGVFESRAPRRHPQGGRARHVRVRAAVLPGRRPRADGTESCLRSAHPTISGNAAGRRSGHTGGADRCVGEGPGRAARVVVTCFGDSRRCGDSRRV